MSSAVETIQFINFPFAFTDAGNRYEIKNINGDVRVGAGLDKNQNVVIGAQVDPDCAGGQCPIK